MGDCERHRRGMSVTFSPPWACLPGESISYTLIFRRGTLTRPAKRTVRRSNARDSSAAIRSAGMIPVAVLLSRRIGRQVERRLHFAPVTCRAVHEGSLALEVLDIGEVL